MHRNVRVVNNDSNMKAVVAAAVELTVADSAVPLPTFAAEATEVFISVDSAAVRVTFDGSDPTTAIGHYLDAGWSGTWSAALARTAKFIRTGGTSGYVYCTPCCR